MSDQRSHQATLLVRGLATLPGSMAVNVVAKKFPRHGPAEAGTGYEQEEHSFACEDIPDPLPMPHGMDEIIITLQGVMNAPGIAEAVQIQLSHLLRMAEFAEGWDYRAQFGRVNPSYQVTVFTESFVNARGW